jgi:hypothetical protein
VTGLNLYSLLVAVVGAVVLLVVYHAIRRVSSCLSRYTHSVAPRRRSRAG